MEQLPRRPKIQRIQDAQNKNNAGWSSPVARQAHNLKVAGSNPAPATKFHNSLVPQGAGLLSYALSADRRRALQNGPKRTGLRFTTTPKPERPMDQSEHKILLPQPIKKPGLVPGFLLEPLVDFDRAGAPQGGQRPTQRGTKQANKKSPHGENQRAFFVAHRNRAKTKRDPSTSPKPNKDGQNTQSKTPQTKQPGLKGRAVCAQMHNTGKERQSRKMRERPHRR